MNERWRNIWIPPWVEANFPKIMMPVSAVQEGEKVLFETEYAISKLQPNAQVLVSRAFNTPAFAERIENLVLRLARRPGEEKIKIFRKRVAGALFEIVAFDYLKSKSVSGELVVAPWDTYEWYAQIFQDRGTINHYGQNLGIVGITVPDGLIFKVDDGHTRLTGICEYSLTAYQKQKQAQSYTPENITRDLFPSQLPFRRAYVNATLGQYFKKQCPQASCNISLDHRNFRVVWIFPQETHTTLKGEVLFVPFLRSEFSKIIDSLLEDLS